MALETDKYLFDTFGAEGKLEIGLANVKSTVRHGKTLHCSEVALSDLGAAPVLVNGVPVTARYALQHPLL